MTALPRFLTRTEEETPVTSPAQPVVATSGYLNLPCRTLEQYRAEIAEIQAARPAPKPCLECDGAGFTEHPRMLSVLLRCPCCDGSGEAS